MPRAASLAPAQFDMLAPTSPRVLIECAEPVPLMMKTIRSGLASAVAGLAGRIERRARAVSYRLANRANFSNLQIHESMLSDAVRVSAYAAALPQVVKRGQTVFDFGTGTGVLALLAAKAGAGHVHAVDHSAIIEVARRLAAANGLPDLTFYQASADDVVLPHKVDLLVHEQMGHYLFEERMVTNLTRTRDRLVVAGGRILPARFEFFVEPVQVKDAFLVPFIWEQRIAGLDYSSLKGLPAVAVPSDYRRTLLKPFAYQRLLAPPSPALEFDLDRISGPGDLPRVFSGVRVVETPGRFDGLCVYFRALLDRDAVIDTSPFVHAHTSWSIPLLRVENRREVAPGDRIAWRLEADDLETPASWRWTVTFEPPAPVQSK